MSYTSTGTDCSLHVGIPADVRCCLKSGHESPCVAAAAHLIFGPGAVVLTLPNSAEELRARQRAALAYSANVLEAYGASDGAAILRARAAAVQCGFPAVVPNRDAWRHMPEADPSVYDEPEDHNELE